MLTIIHGADFHLDAPFAALPADKARQRREEQRALLDKLADLAEERQADLVLLSGDLLDGSQTYQETVEALARTHRPRQSRLLRSPVGVRQHRLA